MGESVHRAENTVINDSDFGFDDDACVFDILPAFFTSRRILDSRVNDPAPLLLFQIFRFGKENMSLFLRSQNRNVRMICFESRKAFVCEKS